MKIIGKRTGLVWPDEVSTLDELCAAERAASRFRLPSGDPQDAEEDWLERLERQVRRDVATMRGMQQSLREAMRE